MPQLSEQDRHAKILAMRPAQDTNSKIEAVLTDAQKQKPEQMLAQRRQHRVKQPRAAILAAAGL